MKKIFQKKYVSIISIATMGIVLGLIIQFAQAWTPPSVPAPNGNVSAPLLVTGDQQKDGKLSVKELKIKGFAYETIYPEKKSPRCACDVDEEKIECNSPEDFGTISFADGYTCYDQFLMFVGRSTLVQSSAKFVLGDSLTVINDGIFGKWFSASATGGVKLAGGNGITFSDGSIQRTALHTSVDDSLCHPIDATNTQCKDGYYMKSPTRCCPFNANMAAATGTWFKIDSLHINFGQGLDQTWATPQTKSFTAPKTVTAMRITGSSDDGGYCYAYWGSGHLLTSLQSEAQAASSCVYNVDNFSYPQYSNAEPNYATTPITCPSGYVLTITGGSEADGYSYSCVKATPMPAWSIDNNGNIGICQTPWKAAGLPTVTNTSLAIPSGTAIVFKGSFVDGGGAGAVTCDLEVQYGN
ncbi:MAG: hypothetical protein ACD_56C00078G0002 [uncultured bacterium]|nr:MAG: hypothetical protein ACD_56C00078G0002 [uncultured bacterium]